MMGAAMPKLQGGAGGVRLTDLQPMMEPASPEAAAAAEDNLFEFTFEKRPFSSNAHYSLQVTWRWAD